jgi:hypothetical protein
MTANDIIDALDGARDELVELLAWKMPDDARDIDRANVAAALARAAMRCWEVMP